MGSLSAQAPLTLVATAFANSEEVSDLVTPDIKHAVLNSKLLFIDLNALSSSLASSPTSSPSSSSASSPLSSSFALGGSALAQAFGSLGDDSPEVDLALLQRAFRYVMTLIKQHQVLAGHDRSDGGLAVTLLEMCFAGDCGADVVLPASVDPVGFLFNEALGWVLEVDEAVCEPLLRACQDHQIPAVIIGTTHSERVIRFRQGDAVLLERSTLELREEWEATSFALSKLSYNVKFIEQVGDSRGIRRVGARGAADDGGAAVAAELPAVADEERAADAPAEVPRGRAARGGRAGGNRGNQGTNCDREMVAAFYKSGFEPWVVTVSDLIERRIDVSQFHGLVFCGGFSFGVGGDGKN